MKRMVRGSVSFVAGVVALIASTQASASSVWAVQTSPNPGPNDVLDGVSALSSTDAWAAGAYQNGSGLCRTLIEHNDGTGWATVASPDPNQENTLGGLKMTSSSNGWAVGSDGRGNLLKTLILHYDGTGWTRQASPNPDPIGDVLSAVTAQSTSDAWAVGTQGAYTIPCRFGAGPAFGQRPSLPAVAPYTTLVEHYDGTGWSVQTSANHQGSCVNQLFGAASTSTSDAWAAGYSSVDCEGHLSRVLVEHYRGSRWTQAKAPNAGTRNTPNILYAMSADDPSDVWAVGGAGTGAGGSEQGLILRYNGSSWRTWRTGHGTSNVLFGVKATSPTNVWAVGAFVGRSGVQSIQILHFDGAHWTFQTPPAVNGRSSLNAIGATSASDAFAVGFDAKGSLEKTLVIHHGA